MARPQPKSAASASASSGGKSNVIILAVLLGILAFGAGYGAMTIQADIAQPLAKIGAPYQAFVVHQGDTTTIVENNLQAQGLIRSATFYKIYLKIKGINPVIDPGVYNLSPSMTLSEITNILTTPPKADVVNFTVKEGLRLTQYPESIISSAKFPDGTAATLPNFSAQDFLKIAVSTGVFPNSSNYWYVQPWSLSSGAEAALEGYLMPNTYQVYQTATAADIISTMLDNLGEQLCPGPASNPTEYIYNQAQCMAHQATITLTSVPSQYTANIGKPIGVFSSLTNHKETLKQALILASLAQREARTPVNYELVASTYYNRWKDINNGQTFGLLGADPAEQYYLGRNAGPTADPWAPLPDSPGNLPNNPYNLYKTVGLPPSPIAGVTVAALYAGIDPPSTNYAFFYFAAKDCQNHYFSTLADFNNAVAQDPAAGANDCQS